MYLGEYHINDYVLLAVQLHRFSSGAEYAATGTPTYTVYENNSTDGPDGNPAAPANLANLATETGLWTARVQLTAAAGYEAGKDYLARVEATVDGVTAAEVQTFRVVADYIGTVVNTGGTATLGAVLGDFANTTLTSRLLTVAILAKLTASAGTIEMAAAAAGTLSTTQMTTNLTEATNDHYNGRIIIWTSGVLTNQATAITDYDGATKMLTFAAVTEAPTAADTFVIV